MYSTSGARFTLSIKFQGGCALHNPQALIPMAQIYRDITHIAVTFYLFFTVGPAA